jgi:thiamine-phosphate pyrophosphorylase
VIQCYITDRHKLPLDGLAAAIARNLAAGVDWIQIREKDLSAGELLELVRAVQAFPNPRGTKILVNTRIDVALAAGADGAHLPAGSPPPSAWRDVVPQGFLIGVSCHTLQEVQAAEHDGAAYAILAPVFAPRSKPSSLAPLGLGALEAAARAVRIPVIALGGITQDNAASCVRAGAAGVASISLFQEPHF